jgi:hypothetical protein
MNTSSDASAGAIPAPSTTEPTDHTPNSEVEAIAPAPLESGAPLEAAPLEPAATDRFAYGGQTAASLATDRWRAASASVTGPSHVRRGTPCEDAAAAGTHGKWLTAVVCDGAGSAQFGGRGAETAAARIVAELLARVNDGETSTTPDVTAIEAIVVDALTAARDRLVEIAALERVQPAALSSTVVGAVWREDVTLLFHIGDGAAVAFDAANTVLAASTGPQQEYANETYFLTDPTWRKALYLQTVSGVESLLLMSDGVTPFALDLRTPKAEFVNPVLDFLRTRDVESGALALQRLIDKPEAQQVADDKTFLWAQRVTPRGGKTHAADTTVDTAVLDQ